MKRFFQDKVHNLDWLISFLTISTFFILTPLYIYFSSTAIISNFLDEKYYLIETLFLIVLLIRYRPIIFCNLEKIWIFTFLYFILFLFYDIGITGGDNIKSFRNLILTSALYYLIGKTLFKSNTLFLYFIVFIILILNFNINDGRLDFYKAIESNRYGSYLEISHKFLVGILMVNFSLNRVNFIATYLVPIMMIVISFMIGARSDFIISIIIFIIIIASNKNISKSNYLIVFLAFILIPIIFYMLTANSRFADIFSLLNDMSFNERMKLFISGFQDIYENPFLGNYTINAAKHIHNYLFFWQKYGLFPFLSISFLILYIIISKIRIANSRQNIYEYSFSIMAIYIILSLLFFKDGFFEYISLLCGLSGNKFLSKNE